MSKDFPDGYDVDDPLESPAERLLEEQRLRAAAKARYKRERHVQDVVLDLIRPGRPVRVFHVNKAIDAAGINRRELEIAFQLLDQAGIEITKYRTHEGSWYKQNVDRHPEHQNVAVHEAAHAVIAEILGLRVSRATIVMEYSRHGDYVDFYGCCFPGARKWGRGRQRVRRAHAEIIESFAGHLAEIEFFGVTDGFSWWADLHDNVERLERKCGPVDLNRLYRFAQQLVHRHRGLIHEVAARLLRRGTVSGAWLRRFMRDCAALD
jgi:hypothetical protein